MIPTSPNIPAKFRDISGNQSIFIFFQKLLLTSYHPILHHQALCPMASSEI